MSYNSIILADSPFGYWPLADTSGTTADDAMDANNGTYVNAPTLNVTPGPITGESAGWVTFNGSSHSVDVGTLGSLGSLLGNGVSIEAWVKSSVTNAAMNVLGVFNALNSGQRIILSVNTNDTTVSAGRIRVVLGDNTGTTKLVNGSVTTDTGITNGQLHHLAATVNPATNTITVYVDGVSQTIAYTAQTSPDTWANFTTSIRWACRNNFGSPQLFFNGQIGHVAIYNSILPNADILRHYRAGIRGVANIRFVQVGANVGIVGVSA